MVYLKLIQKITPMDVSVSENIGQKRIWKNVGVFSPLAPLDPPMSALQKPIFCCADFGSTFCLYESLDPKLLSIHFLFLSKNDTG